MDWLTNPEIWVAFFTLTALEIVLGIDNIIMISILVSRMPKHMQARTRIFGLGLAMVYGAAQRHKARLEIDSAPGAGTRMRLDLAVATASGPARRKFSRSPIVALPADQLGAKNAPPQRHQVLKPDLQVQPEPRKRGGQPEIRQAFRPRTADRPQHQDPQSRRNLRSQGQSQRQSANEDNRQGASAGQ